MLSFAILIGKFTKLGDLSGTKAGEIFVILIEKCLQVILYLFWKKYWYDGHMVCHWMLVPFDTIYLLQFAYSIFNQGV